LGFYGFASVPLAVFVFLESSLHLVVTAALQKVCFYHLWNGYLYWNGYLEWLCVLKCYFVFYLIIV